jgi:hypothetical protein
VCAHPAKAATLDSHPRLPASQGCYTGQPPRTACQPRLLHWTATQDCHTQPRLLPHWTATQDCHTQPRLLPHWTATQDCHTQPRLLPHWTARLPRLACLAEEQASEPELPISQAPQPPTLTSKASRRVMEVALMLPCVLDGCKGGWEGRRHHGSAVLHAKGWWLARSSNHLISWADISPNVRRWAMPPPPMH